MEITKEVSWMMFALQGSNSVYNCKDTLLKFEEGWGKLGVMS